jgi:tetratricopeptide (TPR) repeat protein
VLAAQTTGEAAAAAKLDRLLLHAKHTDAAVLAHRALTEHPKSAILHCRLAALHAARGRYTDALKAADRAVQLDPKRMEARAWRMTVFDRTGRRDDATKVASRIIDFYNAHHRTVTSTDERIAVARALLQVNAPKDALRVLTRAQRDDKTGHAATIELGRLFLLKGQITDASQEFNAVLKRDKGHPAALIGQAECAFSVGKLKDAEKYAKQALAAAPGLADAHDLFAAMAVIDDDYDAAREHAAKSLAVNPSGLTARAILAGMALARGERDAFAKQEKRVRAVNPNPDAFYTLVGQACARKRRMIDAERMYRTALELNADAYDAMAALGQHLFRQAKYDAAKKLLEASHAIDGFNVRTYNTLNLLDKMETYREVRVRPGLTVRLDARTDGILADYVGRYAARELDALAKTYAYEPTKPITVEVLPTQRYFSARVVGLPHIGAIGVCFGHVVSFTSPREQGGRINWRETLRHELTHAVNLLATDYRVPHWLTEAMAVHEQQSRRPYQWDVLLVTSERLGRLIPVRDLTRGFTRPDTGEQRMLAYCQSEVVLDYILSKKGAAALPALLTAFRDGKELPAAVEAVLGMPFERFEREAIAYVEAVARKLPVLPHVTPRDEKHALEYAAKHPNDAAAQCTLALAHAGRGQTKQALAAAQKAASLDPTCAEARFIIASILQRQRKAAAAEKAAQAAIQADSGYAPAHYLLGMIAVHRGKKDAAAKHFAAAIAAHPAFKQPYLSLAKLHKDAGREAEMAKVLEALIRETSDSFGPAVELAEHYAAKQRWADAARVADRAIGIGPYFAQPHIVAGRALWELGRKDAAVDEMEVAAICADGTIQQMQKAYKQLLRYRQQERAGQLQQKLNEVKRDTAANNLRLARAYLARGDRQKARTAALAAFELDPNNEEVKGFLQRLRGGNP